MTNAYFSLDTPLPAHTRARAEAVNSIFESVQAGFDKLPDPGILLQERATWGTDGGTANAYVVTLNEPVTAYAAGLTIRFAPANTNTGASTINVDGVGPASILRPSGAALEAGDILADSVVQLTYDGTAFRLLSGSGGTAGTGGSVPAHTHPIADIQGLQTALNSLGQSVDDIDNALDNIVTAYTGYQPERITKPQTSGSTTIDPTADDAAYYLVNGTLVGNLTLTMAASSQVTGGLVVIRRAGTNGAFTCTLTGLVGSDVTLGDDAAAIVIYEEGSGWRLVMQTGDAGTEIPAGTEAVVIRDLAGAMKLATSSDGSIIVDDDDIRSLGTINNIAEAIIDVTASRSLAATDWSQVKSGLTTITSQSLLVEASDPSDPVELVAPDDDAVTAPGKSFVIRVASTQVGTVTVERQTNGTINGGTDPVEIVAGGVAVLTVLENAGDTPVMELVGDIVAARTLAGDLTVEGDLGVDDDLTVTGATTLTGAVTFGDNATGDNASQLSGFNVLRPPVAKTASFIFALSDATGIITAAHAATPIVGTIPPNADVAFPIGTILAVIQTGAAAVSLTNGSGVTINKPSDRTLTARAQHAMIGAVKTDTNTWQAIGALGT